MGKQYHFVVVYDTETNEFEVDYDTQEAKFDNEPIWNNQTEEWEGFGEELDDDNSTYNRVADALYFAVRDLKPREEIK
jgi:hypothetical protein